MLSLFKRKNGGGGRAAAPGAALDEPGADPEASSHTAGVKQGNARGNTKKEKGLRDAPGGDGERGALATARRSTGINPAAHDPIDPRMPNLPPA